MCCLVYNRRGGERHMARIHDEIDTLEEDLKAGKELEKNCVRKMINRIDGLVDGRLMTELEGNNLSKRLLAAGRMNDRLRGVAIEQKRVTSFW